MKTFSIGVALSFAVAMTSCTQPASDDTPEKSAKPTKPANPTDPTHPPTTKPSGNRMAKEQSPYLRQHAADPVDWYPWGNEAFEKAKKEGKPVFLSIGYAACHWCHVMQRQSFQNADIASYMNEHYVSIKLDREERPDIDRIYMEACQWMSQGRGGWPLSGFLTHDRKPIFVGTYFAPDRFLDLLTRVRSFWKDPEERKRLIAQAAHNTKSLQGFQKRGAAEELPGIDIMDDAATAIIGTEDTAHGGFGRAPKFPNPSTPLFILRWAERTGSARENALPVRRLLDALLRGGIRDHLAGGFHRYSTDKEWKIPHFEKMLYDQALLGVLFLEGWQIWRDPKYASAVRETLDWCLTDMQAEGGGFISAYDADADHVEGATYVWSLEELNTLLTKEEARCVITWCEATEQGNWVEQAHPKDATKTNILYSRVTEAEVAKTVGIDAAKVHTTLASARKKLLVARAGHPQPARDTKVLTGWNALMISTLARAGAVLGEPRYLNAARATAAMLDAKVRTPNGTYLRSFAGGKARHAGELSDHAGLLVAFIDLFEATLDAEWLVRAQEMATILDTHFKAEDGGYVDSRQDDLLFQTRNIYDGARPSGTSLAALGLVRLSTLTGDQKLLGRAQTVFRTSHDTLVRSPGASGHALIALDLLQRPALKVELHGPKADTLVAPLRDEYQPFVSLTRATKPTGDGTVLVCVGTRCLEPATTTKEVRERIAAALGK